MRGFEEKINEIKQSIKNHANEVASSMTDEEKQTVFGILELVEDLEDELTGLSEILDEVWNRVEETVF